MDAIDAPRRIGLHSDAPLALCVSIHDVSAHTWPLCARLIHAIEAVAPIPLTLLVVPAYHHLPVAHPQMYQGRLEARLAKGDELALHGYTHLDEAAPATGWRERYWREVFTLREGEFAALTLEQARRRMAQGLEWFARRNWPVAGFVAPAWLLGAGASAAITDFPFRYTTTFRNFHLLPQRQSLHAPTLLYTARNPAGRWFSRGVNLWRSRLAGANAGEPLLRFGLHPADAEHPALVRNCQHVLARLLERRTPMTKRGFADYWAARTA